MIGCTSTTCWSAAGASLDFIGPGKERFLASEELQDAVIRNIEVIGEAAKRLSPESRSCIPQVDWKRICGMRDVLINDYIGVDLEGVWSVARPGFRNYKLCCRSSC